jgi:HK97 gp10 family phage protein
MAFSVQYKMSGGRELQRALAKFSPGRQRAIARRALASASTLTLRAAKQRAPVETGLLRKSLGKKTKTYPNKGTVVVAIGPRTGFRRLVRVKGKLVRRNPTKYAHLVEFGSRPHTVGKGSSLRKRRQRGVMHPGVAARPFLRPALDTTAQAAIAAFQSHAWDLISRELAK